MSDHRLRLFFWRSNRPVSLSLIGVLMMCGGRLPLVAAGSNKPLFPPEITLAKTIYLENRTDDQNVLTTATSEFVKWGRFTIVPTKDGADLKVVLTHHYGLDKFGNASFIELDVFLKRSEESSLQFKNAAKLITNPQHRTQACVRDFKALLGNN